jgi:hypothetical protein
MGECYVDGRIRGGRRGSEGLCHVGLKRCVELGRDIRAVLCTLKAVVKESVGTSARWHKRVDLSTAASIYPKIYRAPHARQEPNSVREIPGGVLLSEPLRRDHHKVKRLETCSKVS